MDWNRFFASLFVLSLAPVAGTAQPPALDSGASVRVDFTIAQKQTVYQSIGAGELDREGTSISLLVVLGIREDG